MPEKSKTFWTPQGEVSFFSTGVQDMARKAVRALQAGKANPDPDSGVLTEMRKNRKISAMQAKADWGMNGTGMGAGQVSFATGRSRDPMFYWRQSNLPFNYENDDELIRLRKYARAIYLTNPVIASCIDVYSLWPLSGMHLSSKSPELTAFYEELFMDNLDYPSYLPDIAHSYWLTGEAFPLGQFNETLGIWEDDELINPDDVTVTRSPFLKEPRLEMLVPQEIRDIVNRREPEWEFRQLVNAYPELVRYAQTEEYMPVSGTNMKMLAFKADRFFHRGLPIIMRAFRSILQEEMLNLALDSMSSRLYTPLILVRLGASASDMGTDVAWVPGEEELQEFEMALDTALAADFRVLTSHFATDVTQVFGRENMPDLSGDFDRLMDRQLLSFGLSRTILMGASGGETYAADALNRDLVTMLLTRLQRMMKKFYQQRAYVVAKARGHFDYILQGGRRVPIMQERLVADPDGTERIVSEPKLLIPDMNFSVMNLQDENILRQFKEALRATGVPISNESRLVNTGIDLDSEYQKVREEQVRMAVETQETRKEVFLELQSKGYPIPEDLRNDFQARAVSDLDGGPLSPGGPGEQIPPGALPLPNEIMEPSNEGAYVPTVQDYAQAGGDDQTVEGSQPLPAPPVGVSDPSEAPPEVVEAMQRLVRHRPPESDEQRARMPKAASAPPHYVGMVPQTSRNMKGEYVSPSWTAQSSQNGHGRSLASSDTESIWVAPKSEGRYRLLSGPSHILEGEDRRYSNIGSMSALGSFDGEGSLEEWADGFGLPDGFPDADALV